MTGSSRTRPIRFGVVFVTTAATVLGLTFGLALATGSGASDPLPCSTGGAGCISIGFTDAWLNGGTVQLEYSHPFFCAQPPASAASSHCEAGEAATTAPPSGPVVSNFYVLVPMGFTPPAASVQCGTHCIDQPSTIDMTRVLGSGANAVLSARSFVIEEDESFQSTWWPAVLVGVKNLRAWKTIATAKTIESVDACQANGGCIPEAETNAYIFFQVLGPGMSPQGPA